MSGDILQTPDAPKPQGALDNYFKITARGSTVRQEVLAGLTTFLAMVYSVIVVPGMLGKAGFPPAAVFVATCLVAGFGSLLMGLCDAPRDKRTYFREINYIAAAFQYQKKNYKSA